MYKNFCLRLIVETIYTSSSHDYLQHSFSLVAVAKRPSARIQQVMQRRIAGQSPDVHLEVQRDVLAAVVKGLDRATDIVEARRQILLLPFPQDAIEVAVMQIKEGLW